MARKTTAAFAIYQNRNQTERAVDTLLENGFRVEDMSVLMADNVGAKDFAIEKRTKAPEAATAGAVAGGTLGLLAGLGTVAIPGIGPLLAAGPLAAALAGVGAAGAVGGLIGSLTRLGIPEFEAKRYEGMLRSCGILLSVHSEDSNWIDRGKALLERTGGEDVSSNSEASADYATTANPQVRHGGGGL